jgi:sugar lactone lactonase YvrE
MEVGGVKLGLINDVVVAADGLVYFTDATTKYNLTTLLYDRLEGRPHGRLLVYNPKAKATEVLFKDLYFANGIGLSKNEEYLLYSETSASRCSKYFLKGKKRGTTEIFIEDLLGARTKSTSTRSTIGSTSPWSATGTHSPLEQKAKLARVLQWFLQ